MLIDDLSQLPTTFKTGTRCILLLHRTKDGAIGNNQRKSIKMISKNEDDWHKKIEECRNLQDTQYPNHRIYCSVNERDMKKSIYEFNRLHLESTLQSAEDRFNFYMDIQNRFFSCLMQPKAKCQNFFLIDWDNDTLGFQDELILQNKIKDAIPSEYHIFDYKTKNGHHFITKPFNPAYLKWFPQVEIKRDALIAIG